MPEEGGLPPKVDESADEDAFSTSLTFPMSAAEQYQEFLTRRLRPRALFLLVGQALIAIVTCCVTINLSHGVSVGLILLFVAWLVACMLLATIVIRYDPMATYKSACLRRACTPIAGLALVLSPCMFVALGVHGHPVIATIGPALFLVLSIALAPKGWVFAIASAIMIIALVIARFLDPCLTLHQSLGLLAQVVLIFVIYGYCLKRQGASEEVAFRNCAHAIVKFRELKHRTMQLHFCLSRALPLKILVLKLTMPGHFCWENYDDCVVLASDLYNFMKWSTSRPAAEVLKLLNSLYCTFDAHLTRTVHKVKTIGDAYIAVAGCEEDGLTREERALAMVDFALVLLKCLETINEAYDEDLSMRIGIDIGMAYFGVIGHLRCSYDIWGDAYDRAVLLEQSGTPGMVHCSQEVQKLLPEDQFSFTVRGPDSPSLQLDPTNRHYQSPFKNVPTCMQKRLPNPSRLATGLLPGSISESNLKALERKSAYANSCGASQVSAAFQKLPSYASIYSAFRNMEEENELKIPATGTRFGRFVANNLLKGSSNANGNSQGSVRRSPKDRRNSNPFNIGPSQGDFDALDKSDESPFHGTKSCGDLEPPPRYLLEARLPSLYKQSLSCDFGGERAQSRRGTLRRPTGVEQPTAGSPQAARVPGALESPQKPVEALESPETSGTTTPTFDPANTSSFGLQTTDSSDTFRHPPGGNYIQATSSLSPEGLTVGTSRTFSGRLSSTSSSSGVASSTTCNGQTVLAKLHPRQQKPHRNLLAGRAMRTQLASKSPESPWSSMSHAKSSAEASPMTSPVNPVSTSKFPSSHTLSPEPKSPKVICCSEPEDVGVPGQSNPKWMAYSTSTPEKSREEEMDNTRSTNFIVLDDRIPSDEILMLQKSVPPPAKPSISRMARFRSNNQLVIDSRPNPLASDSRAPAEFTSIIFNEGFFTPSRSLTTGKAVTNAEVDDEEVQSDAETENGQLTYPQQSTSFAENRMSSGTGELSRLLSRDIFENMPPGLGKWIGVSPVQLPPALQATTVQTPVQRSIPAPRQIGLGPSYIIHRIKPPAPLGMEPVDPSPPIMTHRTYPRMLDDVPADLVTAMLQRLHRHESNPSECEANDDDCSVGISKGASMHETQTKVPPHSTRKWIAILAIHLISAITIELSTITACPNCGGSFLGIASHALVGVVGFALLTISVLCFLQCRPLLWFTYELRFMTGLYQHIYLSLLVVTSVAMYLTIPEHTQPLAMAWAGTWLVPMQHLTDLSRPYLAILVVNTGLAWIVFVSIIWAIGTAPCGMLGGCFGLGCIATALQILVVLMDGGEDLIDQEVRRVGEESRYLHVYSRSAFGLFQIMYPRHVVPCLWDDPMESCTMAFSQVTVAFIQIKGLPGDFLQYIECLDHCFRIFDSFTTSCGVEKVKSTTNYYLVCAGPNHDQDVVQATQGMLSFLAYIGNSMWSLGYRVVVGMANGDIGAGICGSAHYAYDIFGETVNMASRMQVTAPKPTTHKDVVIHISDSMERFLKSVQADTCVNLNYSTHPLRNQVTVKGKGIIQTHLLKVKGHGLMAEHL